MPAGPRRPAGRPAGMQASRPPFLPPSPSHSPSLLPSRQACRRRHAYAHTHARLQIVSRNQSGSSAIPFSRACRHALKGMSCLLPLQALSLDRAERSPSKVRYRIGHARLHQEDPSLGLLAARAQGTAQQPRSQGRAGLAGAGHADRCCEAKGGAVPRACGGHREALAPVRGGGRRGGRARPPGTTPTCRYRVYGGAADQGGRLSVCMRARVG